MTANFANGGRVLPTGLQLSTPSCSLVNAHWSSYWIHINVFVLKIFLKHTTNVPNIFKKYLNKATLRFETTLSPHFCWGECPFLLAQRLLSVALAWHKAGRNTPFGITMYLASLCVDSLRHRSKEQKKARAHKSIISANLPLCSHPCGKGNSAINGA